MNKKLQSKLDAKAAKVKEITVDMNAAATGRAAFNQLGGSYGITINPFAERERIQHANFRLGFQTARDLVKGITRGRITKGAFGRPSVHKSPEPVHDVIEPMISE